ncbi:MAG: hypothetical protein R3B91_19110 [Planctomycetaceae bacterium]
MPSRRQHVLRLDLGAIVEDHASGASIFDHDLANAVTEFEFAAEFLVVTGQLLEDLPNSLERTGEAFFKILLNMMQNWLKSMSCGVAEP